MKGLSSVLCHSPKFIRKMTASFLGSIAWAFTPMWRKTMAVENIKACLGVTDGRAQEIAEDSVRRFGRIYNDIVTQIIENKSLVFARIPKWCIT